MIEKDVSPDFSLHLPQIPPEQRLPQLAGWAAVLAGTLASGCGAKCPAKDKVFQKAPMEWYLTDGDLGASAETPWDREP